MLKSTLAKKFDLDLVGASFGVIKLHGHDIDVALPRRETKLGEGHRAFEIDALIGGIKKRRKHAPRADFTRVNCYLLPPVDDY